MREQHIASLTCSVARTIGVIGDPWALLLVRELFLKTRRFDDFQANTGMSPKLLTARLRRLEEAGVITRTPYQQRPARYEYKLTDKGKALYPVIVSMTQWGNDWERRDGEVAPPLELTHRTCGHAFEPVMTCSCCRQTVAPKDVDVTIGEAMLAERAALRERFLSTVKGKLPANEVALDQRSAALKSPSAR